MESRADREISGCHRWGSGWVGVGGRRAGGEPKKHRVGKKGEGLQVLRFGVVAEAGDPRKRGAELKEQEEGQKLCDCQFLLRVGCRAQLLLASVCKFPLETGKYRARDGVRHHASSQGMFTFVQVRVLGRRQCFQAHQER
jgi:hypothetical protein